MNLSMSLYFTYGFLTLLGICILFSLVRAIYHFYKKRTELNDIAEDSASTESQSVSNSLSVSERQPENNASESDRLNLQLDKLRKLLNRLNAMGTFSRDTIGDLSEQSVSNMNQSKEALSDMTEFWSSIDFDEFEDSTINKGNFQKTLTEKSISVSDFSLDTSGVHMSNFGYNNFPLSSNTIARKTLQSQNNPSEAIAQILTILDSIMMRNRPDIQSSEKNTLQCVKNTNEPIINKNYKSRKPPILPIFSTPSVSLDKESFISESLCSDTLISAPESEESETLKSETEVKENITSKLKFLNHMSQAIETKNRIGTRASIEAKISKGMSVVNISSSSGSRDLLVRRLSSSSKSIDARKFSLSQSVAICIDPDGSQSTISESTVLSRKSKLQKNEKCENISVTGIHRMHPCTLEVVCRTQSLSNLLVKKLPIQSIQPCFIKSCSNVTEYKQINPALKTNEEIAVKIPELPKGSKTAPSRNAEAFGTKSGNCKTPRISNNSRSSKSLHSQIITSGSLKLSISESEIRQSPFLGCFSPNLTPSNSETFLSPMITESMSSGENIDWKSPVEPIASVSSTQNLTPYNENATNSTNARLWCTPPSPK